MVMTLLLCSKLKRARVKLCKNSFQINNLNKERNARGGGQKGRRVGTITDLMLTI